MWQLGMNLAPIWNPPIFTQQYKAGWEQLSALFGPKEGFAVTKCLVLQLKLGKRDGTWKEGKITSLQTTLRVCYSSENRDLVAAACKALTSCNVIKRCRLWLAYWSMDCDVVRKMLSVQVLCVCVHVVCEITRLKRTPLENLRLENCFYLCTFVPELQFPSHKHIQDHEISVDICLFVNCILWHI